MSFLDELIKDFELIAAVEASRDSNGTPDPYLATGLAHGVRGDLSFNDTLRLGAILGAQGAFDDPKHTW